MSLLMDALRKAEKEKKDAELRRKTEAGELQTEVRKPGVPTGTGRSALDITDENKIPVDPATAWGSGQTDPAYPSSPLALTTPLNTGDHTAVLPSEAERSARDVAADMTALDPAIADHFGQIASTHAMGLSLEDRDDEEDPFDETFHSADLDLESVPELYEETMQGEEYEKAPGPSFDETLPGVPAVELARDIGEEFQPTPVAAQTVFTAAGTARRRGRFSWPMLTIALVIVMLAVSVIVYNSITPIVREFPSVAVTMGIESSMPIPPPVMPPEVSESGPLIVQSQAEPEAVSDADLIRGGATRQAVEVLPVADTAAPAAPGVADAVEPEIPIATATAQQEAQITDSGSGTGPVVPDALPDDIDVAPGMIRISRSKAPEERGSRLNEAYSAWRSGDLLEAKKLYRLALESYPGNRDALLGLAAIALTEGDSNGAKQFYANLLATNPGDELAYAALIGLEQDADPVSRESAMKVLIQEHPEQPYHYFTLGNIFASQQRWAEAQQAFFDAYRLDTTNPDYANNLAVSLDRIGQYRVAVDYYMTALELAKTRAAKFSEADLLSRIQLLENSARP
ncbi:MAG: hypothetical protein A3I78_04480 [Gammaproteobacteria bacterium RIFCSPLOWO2_02_FULL_56_15]|nr:MAG: hypothetical protein A3I78_04480 [Gammaproteobacteria bacterium RIFCSPLOWO2_02_FULL_56_15]